MKRSPRLAIPLSHGLLRKIGSAIVAARLAGSREALLGGVSAEVVARLPIAASPDMQVLSDLERLNALGAPGPLETYLETALHFAGAYAEPAAVLQTALAALRAPPLPALARTLPIRKDRLANPWLFAGLIVAVAAGAGSIWTRREEKVVAILEPEPAPRAPLRIKTISVRGAEEGEVRARFTAMLAPCSANAPVGTWEVTLSINEGRAGVALQPPAPSLAACLTAAAEQQVWPKFSVAPLGLIVSATIE